MILKKNINKSKFVIIISLLIVVNLALNGSLIFTSNNVLAAETYTYNTFNSSGGALLYNTGNITISNGYLNINNLTVQDSNLITPVITTISSAFLSTSNGDIPLDVMWRKQIGNKYQAIINQTIQIDATWLNTRIYGVLYKGKMIGGVVMYAKTDLKNGDVLDRSNLTPVEKDVIIIDPPPKSENDFNDLLVPTSGAITIIIEMLNDPNLPTISVTSPSVNYVCPSSATALLLQGEVGDQDNGDILTVRYNIDGGATQNVNGIVTSAGNFTPTNIDISSLLKGTHTLNVWCNDNYGGSSNKVIIPFKIDFIPNEDGSVNKNNTTQKSDFNIIVNAETGAVVTATTSGGIALKGVTNVTVVNGKATLPIDIAKLTEGANTLNINAKDSVGNVSGNLVINVTKDTISPVTPSEDGSANKNGTTQKADFNIIVNAETNAKVVAINGSGLVLKGVVNVTAAGGKATLPIDITKLSEGPNSITINVTDAAGNVSANLVVNVTKDTIPPVTPVEDGTANKAGTLQKGDFNIIVNTETNGKVVAATTGSGIVLKGVANVTAVNGKATLPIDITKLSEGDNSITINVTDTAGNLSGNLVVSVTKDTIIPITPTEDGTANKAGTSQNGDFSIIVNAETNAKVIATTTGSGIVLKGVANVTAVNVKATLPIDITKLSEGANSITINVTDAAGNLSGNLVVSVTKDTIIPITPTEDGTANKAGTSQNGDFSIIVNAETNAKVIATTTGGGIVLKGVTNVTAVNGKATLPIDTTKLSEGVNIITINQTDIAENISGNLLISINKISGVIYSLNCTENMNYNVALTGTNITNFSNKKFTVEYNANDVMVTDLCSLTKKQEFQESQTGKNINFVIGIKIEGTDITVWELTPGKIVFSVDKNVSSGMIWSGVLDVIKFKALKTQPQSTIKISKQ